MAKFKYTAQRGLSLLGDEVGAWMADTTAETLVGSELVTNGDMSSTANWTSSNATLSIVAGKLRVTSIADGSFNTRQGVTPSSGADMLLIYDVDTAGMVGAVFANVAGMDQQIHAAGVSLTNPVTYVSNGASDLSFTGSSLSLAGAYFDIDNVSVRLAVPDLSTANNGLGVYGSIVKSEVATGAGLMGYSGFSGSNYLEQPYNNDLDFGTGDFAYAGWMQTSVSTGTQQIIMRGSYSGAWDTYIQIDIPSGTIRITTNQSGVGIGNYQTTDTYSDGVWRMVCMVRSSNTIHLYVDGTLIGSDAESAALNLTDTDATLSIGEQVQSGGGQSFSGGLALWRVFSYAPTAAQIKSIYNDEKHLFKKYSTYTQKGESYTLDIPLQAADRTRKMIGKTVTTLSGKRQTLVHRNEQPWNIKTGFIHRTDNTDYPLLSEVDEFIYSTRGSEVFTADVYDSGDDENMVMLSTDISDDREEQSDIFTASFNMQESNQ